MRSEKIKRYYELKHTALSAKIRLALKVMMQNRQHYVLKI